MIEHTAVLPGVPPQRVPLQALYPLQAACLPLSLAHQTQTQEQSGESFRAVVYHFSVMPP